MAEKWSVLEISDGTVSIDLLRGCLKLQSWKPQTTELKDSGVFGDSPFNNGREILYSRYTNVTETFDLVASANSQNTVAYFLRTLRQLLVKARQYTTTWSSLPVWIECRAYGETNSRYARVISGSVPGDDEIFGVDFAERQNRYVVMKGLTLVLEREPFWRSRKPAQSSAVSISSVQSYGGRDYGRGATTLQEVYIANKHTQANLTNVYYYDASGTSFSSNLIGAALPFAFLPATPASGDICYFGCDTSLFNSGPFSSLVFDISTVQVDLTVVWEYYNGASWASLAVTDNTKSSQPFDQLGVHSVHWIQPSNWAAVSINGVTALWVRARVTAVGGGPIPPKQNNRDFYTITNPFVDIAATQIAGDEVAQIQVNYRNTAYTQTTVLLNAGDVMMASRSLSRGANFTPYINLSDEQNNASITVSLGVATLLVNDMLTPTGKCLEYTPASTESMTNRCYVTIASSLFAEYFGRFHVFIGVKQLSGSAGDIGVRFRIRPIGGFVELYTSDTVRTASGSNLQYLDFGLLTLPPGNDTLLWGDMNFYIDCDNTNAANPKLRFMEFILMPVDEWAGSATDSLALNELANYELVVDGISPKSERTAIIRNPTTLATIRAFRYVGSDAFLQHDSAQRLWFFQRKYSGGWGASSIEFSGAVQLWKNQQYFSMRGDG